MGYYLQVGAAQQFPLANISGMKMLREFVEELPSNDNYELQHLVEYGYMGDFKAVSQQAEKAMKLPGTPAPVVEIMQAMVESIAKAPDTCPLIWISDGVSDSPVEAESDEQQDEED